MKTHNQQLVCHKCHEKFINKKELIEHVNLHLNASFECKYCPKNFIKPRDKRQHEIQCYQDYKVKKCMLTNDQSYSEPNMVYGNFGTQDNLDFIIQPIECLTDEIRNDKKFTICDWDGRHLTKSEEVNTNINDFAFYDDDYEEPLPFDDTDVENAEERANKIIDCLEEFDFLETNSLVMENDESQTRSFSSISPLPSDFYVGYTPPFTKIVFKPHLIPKECASFRMFDSDYCDFFTEKNNRR